MAEHLPASKAQQTIKCNPNETSFPNFVVGRAAHESVRSVGAEAVSCSILASNI